MELRDYQQALVRDLRRSFASGKRRPIACLPTGGGKTVIATHIAQGAIEAGNPPWIIAHRKELIRQAAATLEAAGIRPGIIRSGVIPNPVAPAQVASIHTLVRRIDACRRPGLIMIDECHHAVSGSYRTVIDAFPDVPLVGFTATPQRLDGKGLGDVFDDLVMGPNVHWLMEEGRLSFAKYYAPPQMADFSRVEKRGGDYARKQLEEAMDRPQITGDAVEHYRKFADGQPALVFCVSVRHAEDVAAAYRAAGYRAESVDGSLGDDTRDARINGLADGSLEVLTSCDLIGEGLDIPHCVVAQLLRPTASLGLHLQQIGRVLRPADGKDCAIILDHVGNVVRHGFAETEREWTLEGRPTRGQNVESVAARSCPKCFSCHDPAPACPICGHVYPPSAREIAEREGALAELEIIRKRRDRGREESEAESFEQLVALATRRGYRNPRGWAWHRHQARKRKRAFS